MVNVRAAIYCRISKDREGAGLGVERQEADCRELADRLGWTVVQVFPDNDMSAYSGKPRKQYLRMLEAIGRGEVDAVLCWHTDRLHRSPAELEDYIRTCDPREIPTHCVKAGPLDLSTPSGRLVARQLGAVARYEVEHMSERIRGQKEKAVASIGYIGGARPFGYGKVIRDDKKNIIGQETVEAEAAFIRDAVTRVISGESVHAITKQWKAAIPAPRGGDGWTPMNVRRVLMNPRNAGLVVHNGRVVEGARGCWEAIITEDEWRAVTDILNNPDRVTYSGSRSLKWLGTGLYRCGTEGCGAPMRSAGVSSRGKDGAKHAAYRCRTGAHVSIRAEQVDERVHAAVCGLLAMHGADLIERPDDDDGGANALHEQANTYRARLDELEDMLGDGELSRSAFVRQRDRIQSKLDAVNEQLAARASCSVLAGVADAPDPAAAYLAQAIERQRSIVDSLMLVTVLPGKAGRLPKGVTFDAGRLRIEPKEHAA